MLFMYFFLMFCFFFKQKTAYEMRISDWSSDVCSSDLSISARTVAPEASGLTSWGGEEEVRLRGLRPLTTGGAPVQRPPIQKKKPAPARKGKRGQGGRAAQGARLFQGDGTLVEKRKRGSRREACRGAQYEKKKKYT